MKKKKTKNRFEGLGNEIDEYLAGKTKWRTTLIDDEGVRTVFWASGPDLKERRARTESLKKLRDELDLSQPEMAKAIGVGLGTLRNWEYGRRKIPNTAMILMKLLHDLPAVRKRLLAA